MTEKNLTRASTASPAMRCFGRRAFVTLVLCLSVECHAEATPSPEVVEILAGELYQHSLRADDELSLLFVAQPSETHLLEIEQGGLDLAVTVEAPDGSSLSYNSPLLRDESELVVLNSPAGGSYKIRISSDEYTGSNAQTSALIRPAAEFDADLFEALHLIADASATHRLGTMEAWSEALAAYEKALGVVPPSDRDRLSARSLFSMASVEYWQMARWRRAAQLAGEAAAIYASGGHSRLAASANQLRAAALLEETTEIEKSANGKISPEALVLFQQAEGLFREVREIQLQLSAFYDAALSANYIGMTHYYMGDWELAIPWFRQAAKELRSNDEWSGELIPLGNLAVIDFERGKLLSAIDSFERILDILPSGKSQRYRADTLDNLAASQLALGRLEDALKNFSAALTIQREIVDKKGEGRSLAGIGVSYFSIGEQELAIEHLQSALATRRAVNDGRGQVSVLNFIGNIQRQRGEIEDALRAHREALRLATAPIDQARAQVYLGQDLVAAARVDDAVEALSLAKRVADQTGNRKLGADVSRVTGDAMLRSGQFDTALTEYFSAVETYRELSLRAEESHALVGMARANRAQGHLELSAERASAAIGVVEELRSELIDPELRGFFLSTRQGYYDFLVDTTMELQQRDSSGSGNYLRQALAASERSRARALIDLIIESSIGGTGTSEDHVGHDLYQRMAEARYRLNNAIDRQVTDSPEPHSSIADIQRELAAIENELNLMNIRRREEDPALANLTDPRILGATEMQQMLEDNMVLLQYDLGEVRSYVWRVDRESIEAWTLPGRNDIEQVARSVFGLLQAPANAGPHREAINSGIDSLSEILLGPVGGLNSARVIVVADGVLQYLPFALLNDPAKGVPLLENHEIVYLPSVSVLAAQRAIRKPQSVSPRTIAIFADPVFGPEDVRVAERNNPVNGSSGTGRPETFATTPFSVDLNRLPATQFEAQAIAELVPANQRLLETGFDASKSAVLNAGLADYRMVHFATHGLIDSRYPALSSLVLSRIDADGRPRDGYLRLADLYRLRLDAELVALSACSTALGREIAGEGLTGLTQALMYSGTRSVLASLWQVPDRATAELMRLFYKNLLERHQRPAAALRNAQLTLVAHPRWRSPYYWSGFVLQGEWQ